MLIISRKKTESLIIGGNIEITVIDIQGDRVRIGIEAPGDIKIVRKELLETEDVNREAAGIKVKPDFGRLKEIGNKLKRSKGQQFHYSLSCQQCADALQPPCSPSSREFPLLIWPLPCRALRTGQDQP